MERVIKKYILVFVLALVGKAVIYHTKRSNKMAIKDNDIYSFARLAKERLKRNNYMMTTTPKSIDNSEIMTSYISAHKKKPSATTQKARTSFYSEAGEEFYKKVCHILERGNTRNPISELIDNEVFCSLCTEDKQHYISSLSAKYKKSRDRYYREHPMSLIL